MRATLFPFIFRCLAYLPLPLLHNLGAGLGWLTWLLSPAYRRKFKTHLDQAGLQFCRNAAIAETGKGALELPRIWLRSREDVLDMVARVSGWDHVEAAWKQGKGIILLTPHLGCFEIAGQYYASHRPITVLYRQSKYPWLEQLIQVGRGASLKLAPANLGGVRRLLKALRSAEAVGMLPDQVPSNGEGIWVPYFGRPAYTMNSGGAPCRYRGNGTDGLRRTSALRGRVPSAFHAACRSA